LRIAERGEHTAKVCCNILHDKHKRHVFLLTGRGEHKITERQKGQKRHVVADEHGTDKGDVDQSEDGNAQIPGTFHNLASQNGKEFDVFECTYDRQRAKQTCQRFPIKVIGVCAVGRDDERGDDGGGNCHAQNDVPLDPMQQLQQMSMRFQVKMVVLVMRHMGTPFLFFTVLFQSRNEEYYTLFLKKCQ
jgi:hypothetical protein